LKEIGPSNELPKKLEETVDQPTVNQNSANRTESKGFDQRNSGPEKKSDTGTKITSSNSKKEDYKKNRHKSPEKFKNIDKRSDRSSHHKKSSTDSARSEKPHRDHHRHRWFIFAFYRKKIHLSLVFCFQNGFDLL
jgi:hypothetical protein